ncbi:MAG: thioredoxin domain-containing protein [Verrucomicrobia bacterium]|nr:thioredoxin domain-containing protein [Verrucomicrobiota bacterium]
MPNALAREKSPYLLQHADNPVHWLPWGEAAFAQARAQQKPIFLSIGYSTCHWCHVMAHESFEDPDVAAVLNEHFVAIKVDREERPDVDKVYMAYVQSLTGHGGWPLSAWLTPELKPFYGGTYFPPADRHGRAGFPAILQAIALGWRNERDKLVAEANRVIEVLKSHHEESAKSRAPDSQLADGTLREAAGAALTRGFQHLYESFDATNGGFGGAPKFPRASNLSFLFRLAALQGPQSDVGAEAVKLAAATLRAMARGGIHDHVGGGYHRYSVDEAWFVPHFEKMLYDQAQIAVNCLEAKQATGDERFGWMARDIFDYVRRDVTSPAGGFFTAEDADSENGGLPASGGTEDRGRRTQGALGHAEGAFYVWTAAELRAVLGGGFAFLAAHFGVEENGNVAAHLDPHGEFTGKNILVQRRSLAETAGQFALTPEEANDRLLAALARLRDVRARRPRPQLDDKVLTANNGLMISALARGSQVLGGRSLLAGDGTPGVDESPASRLLREAIRAAEFVQRELYDPSRGVLFRAWREGRGLNEGFAEDYAFFIQGLLDLYEASFELRWLQWAERLQGKMDELFWDRHGGYFNSAAGDPSIVLRLKDDYDGAEPAPSSVAAMNLLRLGAALNHSGFRQRGVDCIDAFRAQWTRAPHAMPQMLCALELALEPPRHVVLAGDARAEDFRALAAVLHERLGPRRTILAVTGDADRAWWAARAPWMAEMHARGGRATAYVCEEFACQAPATEPEALRTALT